MSFRRVLIVYKYEGLDEVEVDKVLVDQVAALVEVREFLRGTGNSAFVEYIRIEVTRV